MTLISLKQLIKNHITKFGKIIEYPLNTENVKKIDLSIENPELKDVDWSNPEAVENLIFGKLLKEKIGIGGYDERRPIYQYYKPFQDAENPRFIHIGLDIWAPVATKIFTPLPGVLHSFSNNQETGNYGPTIIIEYELENKRFYILYGHLSETSLIGLKPGKTFKKNEILGEIGDRNENGQWPAHLHLQVISDIGTYQGDFPGVVAEKDREYFLNICPDPGIILNIS